MGAPLFILPIDVVRTLERVPKAIIGEGFSWVFFFIFFELAP